jgi:hypothetical protein
LQLGEEAKVELSVNKTLEEPPKLLQLGEETKVELSVNTTVEEPPKLVQLVEEARVEESKAEPILRLVSQHSATLNSTTKIVFSKTTGMLIPPLEKIKAK